MTKDNNNLKFYFIDEEYLDFLRNPLIGDEKVPNTKYLNREKFFISTGFVQNGFEYFAPVSSSVNPNNKFEYSMYDEYSNKYVASVKLNYMIPVPNGVYKRLTMSSLQNDLRYKSLVSKEFNFYNTNKAAISNLVNEVYKLNNGEIANVNNFIKLENAAKQFDVEAHIANKMQKKYQLTDTQIKNARTLFNEKSKMNDTLTLEKVIRIAIKNDTKNSFAPEIKAMVDKEEQVRVFYVEGKVGKTVKTSLQQVQPKDPVDEKSKLTPGQFAVAERLADEKGKTTEEVVKVFSHMRSDGFLVEKKPKAAMQTAAAKAVAKTLDKKPVSKTQEKIAPKQPKKNNSQNSR